MPSRGGRSADVSQRFRSAWLNERVAVDVPRTELLPTVLARAACAALAADGAGLSILSSEHRVPIGASDATATRAERLQFTVGEGPCLDALAQRRAVRIDELQILGDWPGYYAELIRDTPYRSIVAAPLAITDRLSGALDLYFTSPTMAAYVTVNDANLLAAHISTLLKFASNPPPHSQRSTGNEMPAWMYGPPARDRLRVWVAVGVLMSHPNLPAPEALTMLRAHAYRHKMSVEDTSNSLIDATVAPDEFGPLPS